MSQLKTLENYKFDSSVHAYLIEFPFLEQALEDSYHYINNLFGDDTEIVLKVVIDPEIPDSRILFAYIWTELDVDEALTLSDQLFDSWYLHLSPSVRLKLNYNIKFR